MKKNVFILTTLMAFSLIGCSDNSSTSAEDDSLIKVELGEFTYGEFKVRTPAYPIFESVGNEYDILAIGNSPKGRVMRTFDKRCNGYDMMLVTFIAVCGNAPCDGYPAQKINFYPFDDSFQTLVNAPSSEEYNADQDGRLLVFTENLEKIGLYGDVQVVVMPRNSELKATWVLCKNFYKYEL